jgi:hypothetical protein
MWVAREHRDELAKCIVERAKAVTENENAPCVARKEIPMDIKDARALLEKCNVAKVTVMQYGQKAAFDNKVVKWALKNVRYVDLCLCVCVCVCVCVWYIHVLTITNGHIASLFRLSQEQS